MVFSSVSFLLFFLPILLACYFIVPSRCRSFRNLILLGFSLAFYTCGGPRFLLLMLLSVGINFVCGLLAGPAHSPNIRKLGAVAAVVLGLALLGWFKYAGFFGSMLHAMIPAVPVPQVVLPIGISFFTFQGLSYVIDVYRGDAAVQKNILKVALYISFFPQLVAGPIVRYTTVAEEIDSREESVSEFSAGAVRFLFGLGKKMLLANGVATVADAAFGTANPSVAFAWLGAAAYTFQIYFDFSLYFREYHGVLATVAHFPVQLVPGLRLYPTGRQPLLPGAKHFQSVCGLVPHRSVARCQLEFYLLGSLVFPAAHRGKISLGHLSGAISAAVPAPLYHDSGSIQLGAVPGRYPIRRTGILRRHVRQQRCSHRRECRLLSAGILAGASLLLHCGAAGPAMGGNAAAKQSHRRCPNRVGLVSQAGCHGAADSGLRQAGHRFLQPVHLFPILRRYCYETCF